MGFITLTEHIASRTRVPRTDGSHTIVKEKYGENHAVYTLQAVPVKRARCILRVPRSDNKTNISCSSCHKHTCKTRVTHHCPDCQHM